MDNAQRLRVGVIGCGSFATQAIWPSLRFAPVNIEWAFSRDLDKASATASRFGARRATSNWRDVLDDDMVEAVVIVGPAPMQHELAGHALAAGKHVFVEKPPAPSLSAAHELGHAATEAGRQLQVGFQKRFATVYGMARAAAANERFGGIRQLTITYSHWRMLDWWTHLAVLSIHAIDLARYFLGDPSEARVLKSSDPDGRHTCIVTMLYPNGASAVLNLSANSPHVQEWVEIAGANQLISARNLTHVARWAEADRPLASRDPRPGAIEEWHPQFAVPGDQSDSLWLQGYAGELVHFADQVLAGRPVSPSIVDGIAALRNVEALLAAPEGFSAIEVSA